MSLDPFMRAMREVCDCPLCWGHDPDKDWDDRDYDDWEDDGEDGPHPSALGCVDDTCHGAGTCLYGCAEETSHA